MAVRDEIREQRRSLKGKSLGVKLAYVWDYYKVHILVAIGILAFLFYLISSLAGHKDVGFGAVFLNASSPEDGLESLIDSEFAAYAGIDTSSLDVDIRTGLYQTPGNPYSGNTDYAAQGTIDTMMSVGDLDALVADPYNFEHYLEVGEIRDLREVMSEEELAEYEGRIYYVDLTELTALQEDMQSVDYEFPVVAESKARAEEEASVFVTPDPSGMDDPAPVGIMVTASAYFEAHGMYQDTACIFGFANGSSRVDLARKLLAYIQE